MQDMITKDTGNSRLLKSVSDFMTLYPTYEDFAAALIAGTLPVDFNGLNAEGIAQQGTPLNKANLLSDATATMVNTLTGTTVVTVNDAINAIVASFKNYGAKIQAVSYVGTGTFGAGNAISVTFDFAPILVFGAGNSMEDTTDRQTWFGSNYGVRKVSTSAGYRWEVSLGLLPAFKLTTSWVGGYISAGAGFGFGGASASSADVNLYAKKSDDGKTISWYCNSNGYLPNKLGRTYTLIAIG